MKRQLKGLLADFEAIAQQYQELCFFCLRLIEEPEGVARFVACKNWKETGLEIAGVLNKYERYKERLEKERPLDGNRDEVVAKPATETRPYLVDAPGSEDDEPQGDGNPGAGPGPA